MEKNLLINEPKTVLVEGKKRKTIALNIKRYTTDVNGVIQDDATLPAALQISYPFHLFGEYDFTGCYRVADSFLSQVSNTILFSVYTWGSNTPLFFFSPGANINGKFSKGDIIFVYVDDINSPNYFTFVQVSCPDGAYASVLSQTRTTQLDKNSWGTFKIFDILFGWVDDEQLYQTIFQINTEFDTSFVKDSFEPVKYYNPQVNKQKKITIPFPTVINQYFGLSSSIAFENSLLTLQLIIYV